VVHNLESPVQYHHEDSSATAYLSSGRTTSWPALAGPDGAQNVGTCECPRANPPYPIFCIPNPSLCLGGASNGRTTVDNLPAGRTMFRSIEAPCQPTLRSNSPNGRAPDGIKLTTCAARRPRLDKPSSIAKNSCLDAHLIAYPEEPSWFLWAEMEKARRYSHLADASLLQS
jgi:hypothetical protein